MKTKLKYSEKEKKIMIYCGIMIFVLLIWNLAVLYNLKILYTQNLVIDPTGLHRRADLRLNHGSIVENSI